MNITLEKIDNLRERANVSYSEAKDALEKTGGNMIDAIIYLENENKTVFDRVKREQSTKREKVRSETRRENINNTTDDFSEGLKRTLKTLNETRVVMYNSDRVVFDISLTITLVLTAFMFPFAVAVFVIGMLTGNRYKIIKKDKTESDINSVFDKASDLTKDVSETLKKSFQDDNSSNQEVNEDSKL